MKEVLQDKGFWATVLLAFIAMAAGIMEVDIKLPLQSGMFLMIFKTSIESKILLFIIPIAAVLPMGAVYVRESSGGFIKLYITRISKMEYIGRKLIQIYASGFLIFLFAGTLLLLLCFLFVYPMELKGKLSWDMLWEVLAPLLRIAVIGGIFSSMSGLFGVLFRNYYMAYGLPFVCYYLLIIVKERYLPKMYVFYPSEWIKCEQDWGNENGGIWVFLFLLSAAVLLLNSLLLRYRLQEV